jgi:hypothetical protein
MRLVSGNRLTKVVAESPGLYLRLIKVLVWFEIKLLKLRCYSGQRNSVTN